MPKPPRLMLPQTPFKTERVIHPDFGAVILVLTQPKKKPRPIGGRGFLTSNVVGLLALTGFEPWVGFVDNVNPALTAHNAAIAVARLERTEGVANFHVFCPLSRGAAIAPLLMLYAAGISQTAW
ncbi:hypothetical protein OAN307_c45910 [Octadecabacter antarcticus 307]|uniref:Uncharacterized protein n=1 Tax=Octadecabacter antarcticus 307 TaxID=391626 RepID=M9RHS9_9RHOB|nr:hypothetical protein OAN307_c45910 [Octadecabacter antarcticus 307]